MSFQGNELAKPGQTWERMNSWAYVIPPSRPASYHLKCIERWLRNLPRNQSVGILGSTPEFVDLVVGMGFEKIVVFEKFPKVYDHMSSFRIHAKRERVMWGDWVETLQNSRKSMAVVLSDLTSGNVPYHSRRSFYNGVRSALVRGGLFIDRVLVGRPLPFNHRSRLDSFSNEPINLLTANRFNCEILFTSDLSQPKGLIDTTAFYDEIIQRYRTPRLTKLLELVQKVTPKGCMWWYGKPWTDLAPDYFFGYKLLETIHEQKSSWYWNAAQMHLLRRSD